MTTTWSEDYAAAYNTVSSVMKGGTAPQNVVLVATLMAAFKRLVEWVVTHQTSGPENPIFAASPVNPFDIAETFGG